ncbi:ABC transporter permease [Corynebacterium sanguinis]|uniref:ABC transporter permease n=1 Tax=Corynebacterium sanguinis TaxID=2594913 RepID=UPI0021A5A26A|nr:ABC transporter permease [Corynebacterium sanguinis]MCT1883244.1 ABC transporter permease [Corynebacterium sanguinis]
MFVGIREIKAALGRFSLIVGVVGLITLLVVMLTGLTTGLGKQNTSALEALNPQSVTFKNMDEPSYATSRIASGDVSAGATPLGTGQTMLTSVDGTEISAAVLGLPRGTVLPTGTTLGDTAVASTSLGLAEGEEIGVGGASISVGETAGDLYYSHSPVLWVPTETWQAAMHTDAVGTVALNNDDSGIGLRESFNALPAYGSEQGSLKLIQGFLYAIAALVTVAFLTVWTIQRTRDLSILRALGASSSYLRKDALGQAALILAVGVIGGGLIALGLGLAAAQVAPFSLSVLSIVGPPLALWLLGMAGAWLATRSITKIDPQQSLGGIA